MQGERVSNYVASMHKEVSNNDFSLIFCTLRNSRADICCN